MYVPLQAHTYVYCATDRCEQSLCLLHPKSRLRLTKSSVTVLWVLGSQWVLLFCSSVHSIIMIISFINPSLNSVPPHVSCFQTSLCFMFLFYFIFSFPLVLIPFPKPQPWYMPYFHYCYTLSCPKSSVTMLWVVGLWWVLLFHPFHSVCHHVYLVYSSIPEFRSPLCFMFPNFALFHVSVLLRIFVPLVLFSDPWTPTLIYAQFSLPWYALFRYIYILNFMYVPQSEIDIDCPSNSSSELLNPCPKFEDSRCLVAQHISWSQVLAKHLTPWYTLGPCLVS